MDDAARGHGEVRSLFVSFSAVVPSASVFLSLWAYDRNCRVSWENSLEALQSRGWVSDTVLLVHSCIISSGT